MNIQELFSWLKTKHPSIVESWESCSHYYSSAHPNPYHLEDSLLNHQLMIFNECEKKNISLQGNIACLFHDLGKPLTRELNHEKKRASMLNHEPVSAFFSLDMMNSLSQQINLSPEDKINIFFAICYHVDFHQTISSCLKKDKNSPNRFQELVSKYKGQPEMTRILIELGVCDSLGRESDPVISPKHPELETLIQTLNDSSIYQELSVKPTRDKNKPIVEMLIGLPCSGKTQYSKEKRGFTIIEKDSIALKLTESNTTKEAYADLDKDKFNQAFDKLLKASVRNKSNIVFDNNHFIKHERKSLLAQCKGYHKKAVLFLESMSAINNKNNTRMENGGHEISIYQMIKDFTPPSFNEFDEIVVFYEGKKVII